MSEERLQRQRRPVGEGCECVDDHAPSAYVPAEHHVLPQSWGGQTVTENLVLLCPNSHTAVHRLIDEYVRSGGDPGWEVRRHFGVYVRELALRAWRQRPAHPTITSAVAPHGTYAAPHGACVECGNDDPAEGFIYCTDCLEKVTS